jgi:hypothetical protein
MGAHVREWESERVKEKKGARADSVYGLAVQLVPGPVSVSWRKRDTEHVPPSVWC